MKISFGRRSGVYYQFSNFFSRKVVYKNITYGNTEAPFQAMKSLDTEVHKEFANLSGGQAKKKGRSISLRSDWEDVKFDIMCDVLMAKFTQNEDLKELLLGTGDALLVENTTGWHDNNWGCCDCSRCHGKMSKNMLGMALMRVRSNISGLPCVARFTLGDKEFVLDFDSEDYKNVISTYEGRVMMSNIFRFSK